MTLVLSVVSFPCSPLSERQRPGSASLQRLSAARRRPLAAISTEPAAEAQTRQQPPAYQQQAAAGLDVAARRNSAHDQMPPANLDAYAQRSEGYMQLSASCRSAAETPADLEGHAHCSAAGETPSKAGGPLKQVPDRAAPAASLGAHQAAVQSPFQSAQPPVSSRGTGTAGRQAASAAQGSRRPNAVQAARQPPSKPQSTGAVATPTNP